MNIELHLSGLTAEQLIAISSVLNGTSASVDKVVTNTKPADKPKDKVTEKPKDEPKGDVAEITVEQLTQKAQAYAGKNGRDAFLEVLAGFGVKNISGVPAEQRAALLAKLEG